MDKPLNNSQQLSTTLNNSDGQALSNSDGQTSASRSSTIQEALIATHPQKLLQINNLNN